MLDDISGLEKIYIVCGLSLLYFYSHLFWIERYSITSLQKEKDNISYGINFHDRTADLSKKWDNRL